MTPKIATGILSYTYMVKCSWKTGVPVTKHIAVYTQADEKYWPRIVGIVSAGHVSQVVVLVKRLNGW